VIDKDTGWIEANVTINGHALTFAEAMALRVAVSSFRMFVNNPAMRDGLGAALAEGYDRSLQNIEAHMIKTNDAVL